MIYLSTVLQHCSSPEFSFVPRTSSFALVHKTYFSFYVYLNLQFCSYMDQLKKEKEGKKTQRE